MSNIHGVHSGKKDDDKKRKDVEEFNVGGAQSSTAVQRPIRTDDSLTGDLVSHARAAGQNAGDAPAEIVLYRNGFIVGGGAFRDLANPQNQAILAQIKKGDVPREIEADLAAAGAGSEGEVGVALVNRTTEDYVAPKPKFDFKTSQGQSLGGAPAGPTTSFASAPAQELKLKDGEPTGVVMLVLHPRERVKLTVNESTTVRQIYQHMKALSKVDQFQMLAGFPPTALTNPDATVKEARLLNSSVQQQL